MPFKTPLNLPELARLARSATPGQWKQTLSPTGNRASLSAEGFPYVAENLAPVDADYLETFQPATVTRLISDLTAATTETATLRETLHQVLQAVTSQADPETIKQLITDTLGYVVVEDIPTVTAVVTT